MVKFKACEILYKRVYTSLLGVEEPLEYFNQEFEIDWCLQTNHSECKRKDGFALWKEKAGFGETDSKVIAIGPKRGGKNFSYGSGQEDLKAIQE